MKHIIAIKMITQEQRVLEQLNKGGITNVWAVNHYILRLSARIKELRDRGYNIDGHFIKRNNRKTKVFEYTFV